MSHCKFLLLSSLFFLLSCSTKKEVAKWNLLPWPQMIHQEESQPHRLIKGEIGPGMIRERWVNHIPEAVVNPEEAYRLRITKDSILVEAVTGEGFYRARQTLDQLGASSGVNTIPALAITDWPAVRVRGFVHAGERRAISVVV
ncbi:MAG: glycoside hydrolase family 20 zincin-like fold domain-containing protein, partial [Proteiniphilum sp.]